MNNEYDPDRITGEIVIIIRDGGGEHINPGEENTFFANVAGGAKPPLKFDWDFDDGDSGNGERVKHTFLKTGTFNVKVTVTDSKGSSTTLEKEIEVISGPLQRDDATVTVSESSGSYEIEIRNNRIDVDIDGVLLIRVFQDDKQKDSQSRDLTVISKSTVHESYNLPELENGIYVLDVKFSDKETTKLLSTEKLTIEIK